LENEFGVPINDQGKAEMRAQAATQAATLFGQYLAIAETQKNIWVDLCDEETLIRFGKIKINREPFSALAGRYDITVTGTIGGVIPAETTFKSDDNSLNPGVLYVLDVEHIMLTTSDTINVRALTIGEAGKLNIGDTLTATAPMPVVNSGAVVTAETVQPLAAEDIENYRDIVIAAFRIDAQGGSPGDYRLWVSGVQGVKIIYPYAREGFPSQGVIYIEATIADSIDGKGTPSAQTILDVKSAVNFDPDTSLDIDERGRRPMMAAIDYEPITVKTVVITITGFQALTAGKQASILAALQDSISQIRPFLDAADDPISENDTLDDNKIIGVITLNQPGNPFTSVGFTVNGVLHTSYEFVLGDIPYLNPVIIYN
jgi:hypothetical protein